MFESVLSRAVLPRPGRLKQKTAVVSGDDVVGPVRTKTALKGDAVR